MYEQEWIRRALERKKEETKSVQGTSSNGGAREGRGSREERAWGSRTMERGERGAEERTIASWFLSTCSQ